MKSEFDHFSPNLVTLVEISISAPVTNAWPEWGASALKRLKTRLGAGLTAISWMLLCRLHWMAHQFSPPKQKKSYKVQSGPGLTWRGEGITHTHPKSKPIPGCKWTSASSYCGGSGSSIYWDSEWGTDNSCRSWRDFRTWSRERCFQPGRSWWFRQRLRSWEWGWVLAEKVKIKYWTCSCWQLTRPHSKIESKIKHSIQWARADYQNSNDLPSFHSFKKHKFCYTLLQSTIECPWG